VASYGGASSVAEYELSVKEAAKEVESNTRVKAVTRSRIFFIPI
jgi:hypothetical protein